MRTKIIITALTVSLLVGTTIIFQKPVLQRIGDALVHQDRIEPADAIVVLSGGGGYRIKAGADLFAKGFGKVMIFSGVQGYPGVFQFQNMKNFAIKLGVPENKIIAKELKGEESTWGEGTFNLQILKENHINSFILVTSSFHTHRAYKIYKKLMADHEYNFKFMVYPAQDNLIPVKDWWKTRNGKKHILIEYMATLNFYLEH
jgi:uncharacterized SAM-binding protein YcdF (DUF218 family)